MADIRRKDLKHDRFVQEVGHQVEYFTEHRNAILTIIGAAVVLLVGGGWYYNHQRTVAIESMGALQDAALAFAVPVNVEPEPGQRAYVTSGERIREVSAALETVKTEFAGTEAAAAADYYYALLDLEQEELGAAKAKLQSAISRANEEYASLARLALASVLAGEGDAAAARQEYERLIADPTVVVPASRAQLALARMLAQSDPSAARLLLEELAGASSAVAAAAAVELDKLPQI